MKYLNTYNTYEGIKLPFFDKYKKEKEKKIKATCKYWGITNYTINEDFTIDVDDRVMLHNRAFKKLPLNFNKVKWDFLCNSNKLTTLEGAPNYVGGSFDCSNNYLTSFKGV